MIRLEKVSKTFHLKGHSKVVADQITAEFTTGQSVALLGRNGAGKSSLLRMISGAMRPDSGRITISGSVSWPVGFAGSFHPDLTGAQNVRFVGRVYGVDTGELTHFVEDFAELGAHFQQPVRTYSSGMRSRLAFGLSMGIHFDIYLVDEVTSVGDSAFREKSVAVMNERLKKSGAVIVSHSIPMIRQLCDCAMILENGHLTFFDSLNHAILQHEKNMRTASTLAMDT